MDKLNRRLDEFVVHHGQWCRGGLQFGEVTERDLTATGTAWVSIRCSVCGDSVRDEIEFLDEVRSLAAAAGITEEEFQSLSVTSEGIAQLRERVDRWPGLAGMILGRIRDARGGESRN